MAASAAPPEPRPTRFRRPALLLLVLLPPLLLHLQHLLPGRLPYLRDLSRTHLPIKQVAVAELRAGRLPLWDPGHGAGAPLLANANFFHLHPVTLLFLVLPYGTAFSLGLALLSVAAAAGVFFWARARGASPAGAAVAGCAFALGGLGASVANLYNLLASYAAVPWALAASVALGRAPDRRRAALLALALAAALGGGEPTGWVWAILLMPIAGGLHRGRRVVLAHAGAVALSLALLALQLAPLAATTAASRRGAGFDLAESSAYSLAPERLGELVWPHAARNPASDPASAAAPAFARLGDRLLFSLYPGLATLLLAAAGARAGGRRALPLAAVALLALLLALGRHTPLFPALWQALPPLHAFRYPEKLVLPFFLVIALLAAAGFDALRRRRPGAAAVLAVLVPLDLLAAHTHLVPGAEARLFLEPPPLARALAGRRVYFWLEPGGYLPPGDDLLAFHLAYQRQLVPPAGIPFGIGYVFDPDPDALDDRRLLALARLAHARGADRSRFLRAAAVDYVLSPRPLSHPQLEPRYAHDSDGIELYAVRAPLPWARVVPAAEVRPAATAAEAEALLGAPGFDPERTVVFEGEPMPPGAAPEALAVTWRRLHPARIELVADGPGLLVVAESFASGWTATVDGRPQPVAPANLAFLGIPLVIPGRHQVELAYRPAAARIGGLVSALALLAGAGLLFSGGRPTATPPVPPAAASAGRDY